MVQPPSQQTAQNQQYISQGLNKLRESLVNFRIEDAPTSKDLYVYTNKEQIYLLKLEEIYETTSGRNPSAGGLQTTSNTLSTSQQNQSLLTTVSSSITADSESPMMASDDLGKQAKLASGGSALSRRPSHASINDASGPSDTTITNKYPNKSQNLSGGVVQATQSLTNTVASSSIPSATAPRNNPEYEIIKSEHFFRALKIF